MSSTEADMLFRDQQEGHGFRFQSKRKDVQATVTRQEVVELALYWAMKFY